MSAMVDDGPSFYSSNVLHRRCERKSTKSFDGCHVTEAIHAGAPAVDHVDILVFPVISTELAFEMRQLLGTSGKNISRNPLEAHGIVGKMESAPVGVILHASHGTGHATSSDTRLQWSVKFPSR